MIREAIPAGGDRGGPPPGPDSRLRPWRLVAAVASAPLIALAVFFAGIALNGIQTDYAPLRFLLVVVLTSPVAAAAAAAVAITLAAPDPMASWRNRAAVVAAAVAAFAAAALTWSQVYFSYFPRPWGG